MKNDSKFIIGSHVSMNQSNDYLVGAFNEMINDGSNTMMIYTGAPQNTIRKNVSSFKIKEFHKLIEENNININNMVVHAPYIINLSNSIRPEIRDFGINFLIEEIKRCEAIGINILVLHPGAFVKGDHLAGLDNLIEGLNIVSEHQTTLKIAIETMSGKGTEVGISFEHMKYIFKRLKNPDKIGICLDTCHMNDAGYDLSKWNDIKQEMNKNFDIKKVLVIHLNDSKNPISSHKDRHENIGYGTIGFDILNKIAHDIDFLSIPKILETPYFEEKSVYKKEIDNLKKQKFSDFKNI